MNVGSNIKENDYKKEAAKLCNSTWDEVGYIQKYRNSPQGLFRLNPDLKY